MRVNVPGHCSYLTARPGDHDHGLPDKMLGEGGGCSKGLASCPGVVIPLASYNTTRCNKFFYSKQGVLINIPCRRIAVFLGVCVDAYQKTVKRTLTFI